MNYDRLVPEKSNQPLRLTRLGKIAVGSVVALTVGGFVGGIASANGNSGYSKDQLKSFKSVELTVTEIDNSPAAILANHESSVLGNADKALSEEDYIRGQGLAKDTAGNPELALGQSVNVPIPDGVVFTTSK